MIDSVLLENFKGHTRTEIALGRLTVLVGPNATGKTSVLEAMLAMSELVDEDSEHVFAGRRALGHVARRGASPCVVTERGHRDDGDAWSLAISFTNLPSEGWTPSVTFPDGAVDADYRHMSLTSARKQHPLWRELRSAALLRLDVSAIAGVSVASLKDLTGAGTAAQLATMKLHDDDRFDAISRALREIVPSVRRMKALPAGNASNQNGYELVFDFSGAEGLPGHAASEGTLLALALLTVLHADAKPRLLLLDDIERGLHPLAQMELVKQLKKIQELEPTLQIVATTHSPYILDHLAYEDVRVLARGDDGVVKVKSLAEHPEAERSRGTLTPGELWSLDPETWVLAP